MSGTFTAQSYASFRNSIGVKPNIMLLRLGRQAALSLSLSLFLSQDRKEADSLDIRN
jgi:hypothetical protein